MQCGEQSGLRPLRVGRAAPDADFSNARSLNDLCLERWRAPLGGVVVLLHVVHEIHTKRCCSSGIVHSKHTRFAGGRHHVDTLKPCIPGERRHVLGAVRIIAIFGGDRWQCDPVLQHRNSIAQRNSRGRTEKCVVGMKVGQCAPCVVHCGSGVCCSVTATATPKRSLCMIFV